MAAIYTRRLGDAQLPALTAVEIGVVPQGRVWVIRDVVVLCTASVDSGFDLWLSLPGGTRHLVRAQLPANNTSHFEMRQVAQAGDRLQAFYAGSDATSTVLVTGYEFVLE